MNETERKVVDILTDFCETRDPWADPIHAVDRAMKWATADTITKVVNDLVQRGVIQHTSRSLPKRSATRRQVFLGTCREGLILVERPRTTSSTQSSLSRARFPGELVELLSRAHNPVQFVQ